MTIYRSTGKIAQDAIRALIKKKNRESMTPSMRIHGGKTVIVINLCVVPKIK